MSSAHSILKERGKTTSYACDTLRETAKSSPANGERGPYGDAGTPALLKWHLL